ncbi:hypothetical protein HYT33_02265 [Candidatus Roizmanbacteria bacterium]|nr:hypothetical protein [Candidatus Roizmanbacteria bacterium]
MDLEPKPRDIITVIDELTEKAIKSGELVETPFATFRFPYLSDPRFLKSPFRDEILKIGVPEMTVGATKKAVEELTIKDKLEITTLIPEFDPNGNYKGGQAIFPSRVEIYFYPYSTNLVEGMRLTARTVGHELNHCARLKKRGHGTTLLDDIVSEGLAVYYEEHWGGEYLRTVQGHNLTEEQIVEEFEKAKPLIDSEDYDADSWRWGTGGAHPKQTIYSLGTRLVERFFQNNPKTTMREAVRMKSKRILKGSGLQL